MKIAIIGAGAAGCFAAIRIKQIRPEAEVTVYEGARRPLAKVAVTGGGRCNLTNSFAGVRSIEAVYPRGARLMKRLLREFSHRDAMAWFEGEGVRLVTQEDECVFPRSQRAEEIVTTLLAAMRRHGVILRTGHRVTDLRHRTEADSGQAGYVLTFSDAERHSVEADRVIVTTGGIPRLAGFDKFRSLGLIIALPVPSLFSLCLSDEALRQLAGTVIEPAVVTLAGTKYKAEGPLLITHQGVSGPAVLKLSSYAARHLAETGGHAHIVVNWLGRRSEAEAREWLDHTAITSPGKQVSGLRPEGINTRHWIYLLQRAGLRPETRWSELGSRCRNRLAAILTGQSLEVTGRNPYKGEFVTCGGIDLSNIRPSTLECRAHPGLFFAGEVLDVDAVTGGFNLQAAWTTGYVAANNAAL